MPLATENADLALISSTATAAVIMATAILSPPWLPIIIMTSPYTAIATTAEMGYGTCQFSQSIISCCHITLLLAPILAATLPNLLGLPVLHQRICCQCQHSTVILSDIASYCYHRAFCHMLIVATATLQVVLPPCHPGTFSFSSSALSMP